MLELRSLLTIGLWVVLTASAQTPEVKPGDQSILQKDAEAALKSAEGGNPEGQAALGNYYQMGWGVTKDDAEAARWYLKAAEQGNLRAQHSLAGMYRDGKGVLQNYAEAAKWYRKAIENETGNTKGPLSSRAIDLDSLAKLYADGLGVPQDYAEAARLYRKSVEGGWDAAVFSMYFLCVARKTTEQDCADVATWLSVLVAQPNEGLFFSRAAESHFLGTLYEKGLGVSQNYAEAAKWYRKGADQGEPGSQFDLSVLYIFGRGVPQDLELAHMWLNLAASLETGETQKITIGLRDGLAKEMTREQVAQAQRLAREWKPTKTK